MNLLFFGEKIMSGGTILKNGKHNLLFDGAAALAVATAVTKVLGLLYKLPLSRILGDEGMGYFNSAYTVYTFFYILCSAGVPKAVAIVVSENDAEGNKSGEGRIIRSALFAFFALGIAATAIFIAFAEELCVLIGNSGAAYTMTVIAPSVLFVSIAGVAKGHLSGNSRLLPLAVSQLIEGGAKFFIGVLFAVIGANRGMPLTVLSAFTVLGITLGSAVSAVYLLITSKLTVNNSRARPKEPSTRPRKKVRKIVKIAIPLTVGAAVMSFSNLLDLGMIMQRLKSAGYSEAEASALYGNYTTLAVPMFNLVTSLVAPFFIALLPILSRSHTLGDDFAFEAELNFTLKKAYFIAVPSSAAFIFYSKEILSLIFESSAVETGAPLLTLLAPSLVFLTSQTLVNTALEAKGHFKAPIVSMLVGNVPKLVISYVLISDPRFGISAAPIGTVVAYATGFLLSLLILHVKTDVHLSLISEFLRPASAALAAIAVTDFVINSIGLREGALLNLLTLSLFGVLHLIFVGIIIFADRKYRKSLSICTKKAISN